MGHIKIDIIPTQEKGNMNLTDIQKTLIRSLKSYAQTQGSLSYIQENKHHNRYVDIINQGMAAVRDRYPHLFDRKEMELFETYFDLTYECYPQRLIVRLLLRKLKWIPLSTIKYDEVFCVQEATRKLIEVGLLDTSEYLPEVKDSLIDDIPINQLRIFMDGLNIRMPSTIPNRKYRERVKNILRNQTDLFGRVLGECANVLRIFQRSIGGAWVRVKEDILDLFLKCQALFFLNLDQTFHLQIMESYGIVQYTKYETDQMGRTIFPTIEIFNEFLEASHFYRLCCEYVADENLNAVLLMIKTAKKNINEYLSRDNHEVLVGIQSHYRAFHVWGKVIHESCKLLEKSKKKDFAFCIFTHVSLGFV